MAERSSPTLAGVVAVLGFLLVTAVASARAQRRADAPRKAELIELIGERRSLVGDLDQAVGQLRAEVARERERTSRAGARDREAAAEVDLLAQQAGTMPVAGPGLVVQLANSTRPPPAPEEAAAYRIHDTDLQLVVNAVFLAGAEAVAVNDSRLVSTTAIRAAGDTIVVNFRPLSPPYRIVAIGADRRRFEADPAARRFRGWSRLFGLGFDVRSERKLEVGAHNGRVSISSATPLAGDGGGPGE